MKRCAPGSSSSACIVPWLDGVALDGLAHKKLVALAKRTGGVVAANQSSSLLSSGLKAFSQSPSGPAWDKEVSKRQKASLEVEAPEGVSSQHEGGGASTAALHALARTDTLTLKLNPEAEFCVLARERWSKMAGSHTMRVEPCMPVSSDSGDGDRGQDTTGQHGGQHEPGQIVKLETKQRGGHVTMSKAWVGTEYIIHAESPGECMVTLSTVRYNGGGTTTVWHVKVEGRSKPTKSANKSSE